MRCIVINLPLSWERREAIESEFQNVGLAYELWPATSGFDLSDDIKSSVDYETRDRLGLRRLDDASIGCLLSHLAILRRLVDSTDDMVAVFEDDARLHPDLPDVLDALEGKADKFDVVKLQRRYTHLTYVPVYQLLPSHSLGRVRYSDIGAYGYVITRHAAAHLLERFPWPVHEIDWIIPRFWENGLRNVLYVNPPVVFHDDVLPSHIDSHSARTRAALRTKMRRDPRIAARRFVAGMKRRYQKWRGFRAMRRRDRDIDPYGF